MNQSRLSQTTSESARESAKVLIIGTGIAGLSAALKFADHASVILLSKSDAIEGATRYAQGGIASVWSKTDSFEAHVQDTLSAGAGLCRLEAVKRCVEEGPARVRELVEYGVKFTKDSQAEFDLHREGGHGERRILHAEDLTGFAIESALLSRVRSHPQIKILEHHVAIDLILDRRGRKNLCVGAYALDSKTGHVRTLSSQVTMLATGGMGKVYLYTSNPDVATGDGVAMAIRAGARIANLEFMQFHPTCLYHPGATGVAKNFLISEALRGEGAVLKNLSGKEFMRGKHPLGSLAPRDIVARAIDLEMKKSGDRHVWLDATELGQEKIVSKFPNIHRVCLSVGIDIVKEPIPVVPAAHSMCGGVLVNEHAESSIEGLYAVGEVACTGVHGANRLASNSLLEAVVYAHRGVEHGLKSLQAEQKTKTHEPHLPHWDSGLAVPLEEQQDVASLWLEIRTLMWNYVGIVRSEKRLERAKRRLEILKSEINEHYWTHLLTKDLIELRNLVTVAGAIAFAALSRKESRGLHFMTDHLAQDDQNFLRDTIF